MGLHKALRPDLLLSATIALDQSLDLAGSLEI